MAASASGSTEFSLRAGIDRLGRELAAAPAAFDNQRLMAEYGHAHRKLRQRWARLVADGEVNCARCRPPIHPGQPWDLGHRDADSGEYQGPEHRRCNRTAGGWKRWHPSQHQQPQRWAL